MSRITLSVERTVDNRDLTERLRQLEAENEALREALKARPKLPPGLAVVNWREVIRESRSVLDQAR